MKDKLLTETFMLYGLSTNIKNEHPFKNVKNGQTIINQIIGLSIDEIKDFMRKLGNEASGESLDRSIRRYIDDLIQIGALKEGTRRKGEIERNDKGIQGRISVISYDDYKKQLKNYNQVEDNLKPLYRIAKFLESECGDDPENDDTIKKFYNSYFSNGLTKYENYLVDMFKALETLEKMFEIYESEDINPQTNKKQKRINRKKHKNLNTLLVQIKIKYGYDTK